ncbi:MAG: hypothetical protein PVG07_13765 [Acidobacteriota bacterium]
MILILVAALAFMPGAALAAQPDADAGPWLEPFQQRLGLWLSGLFGGDAVDQPESIREAAGCGADPDGAPCEEGVTAESTRAVEVCGLSFGGVCLDVPIR